MSMQAVTFAGTLPIFERGPKFTLMMLAFHIGYRTGDTFVSQDVIADLTACSVRTVQRDLEALEGAGYIKREPRYENGRRTTDRIELVGYLDWQETVEQGGTIRDPRTRGKFIGTPAEKLPDNLAGSEKPRRHEQRSNTTKTGVIPDTAVVSNEPINQKITTSAREGACVDGAAPSRAEGRKPEPRPQVEITVKRGDVSWQDWLDRLRDNGQKELAAKIEAAGALAASSRWYTPGYALRPLAIATGKTLSPTSKRITGDAAE